MNSALARGRTASEMAVNSVAHRPIAAQVGRKSTFTMKAKGRNTCPTRMMVSPGRGVVGADLAEGFIAHRTILDLLEVAAGTACPGRSRDSGPAGREARRSSG